LYISERGFRILHPAELEKIKLSLLIGPEKGTSISIQCGELMYLESLDKVRLRTEMVVYTSTRYRWKANLKKGMGIRLWKLVLIRPWFDGKAGDKEP